MNNSSKHKKYFSVIRFWLLLVTVLLCIAYIGLRVTLGPSIWKSQISKISINKSESLQLASAHDGDISKEFYVRITGRDGQHLQWKYIGYTTSGTPSGTAFSGQTLDNRFWCVGSTETMHVPSLTEITNMPVMVIYDQERNIIWPSKEAEVYGLPFWMAAWEKLSHSNPQIPRPDQGEKSSLLAE